MVDIEKRCLQLGLAEQANVYSESTGILYHRKDREDFEFNQGSAFKKP